MKKRSFPKFTDNRGGTIFQRILGMRRPRPKIGNRSFVDPSAQFVGCEYVEIGNRTVISEGCWFNVNDRSGTEPRIVIGDHCVISRRSFFSSGRKILIGPYCLIGNESNFLGADHDFSDPYVPYMIAPAINGGDITIGVNCWIGSNCTILKGVSIGHGCVIGAGSVLTKSIPPLSVAVGSPCRVLKRFRASDRRWVSLPSSEDYLKKIREKHEWVSMPYIIGGGWFGNM